MSLAVHPTCIRKPKSIKAFRAEYLLADRGSRIAPACNRLLRHLERLGLTEVGLNKWSLPLVYTLSTTVGRFNLISAALDRPTPRALARTLRDLQDAGLVDRFLVDDDPPRTEYALTPKGKKLIPVLSELAESMFKRTRCNL